MTYPRKTGAAMRGRRGRGADLPIRLSSTEKAHGSAAWRSVARYPGRRRRCSLGGPYIGPMTNRRAAYVRHARAAAQANAEKCAQMQREPLPPSAYILCDGPPPPCCYIYALIDPRDGELVRYVGQTVNPAARYASHTSWGTSVRVREWVTVVRRRQTWPVMICLEVCALSASDEREQYWIQHYRTLGQADLNAAPVREAARV